MESAERPDSCVIGLVLGSSRPGRRGSAVAGWVAEVAAGHPAVRAGTAAVELIDLAEQRLPLLDEPVPALFGDYRHEHTRRWSSVVARCDAFVFVTPEYNRSVPAVLKNALDYLYAEWQGKPTGVVSYGLRGGGPAGDHLREILAELQTEVVATRVELSVFTDFEFSDEDRDDPTVPGRIAPAAERAAALAALLGEIVAAVGARRAGTSRVAADAAGV